MPLFQVLVELLGLDEDELQVRLGLGVRPDPLGHGVAQVQLRDDGSPAGRHKDGNVGVEVAESVAEVVFEGFLVMRVHLEVTAIELNLEPTHLTRFRCQQVAGLLCTVVVSLARITARYVVLGVLGGELGAAFGGRSVGGGFGRGRG